jgi:hypothetical protein
MLAVKGRYSGGGTVEIDASAIELTEPYEVMVSFLRPLKKTGAASAGDDGSLAWLFRDYVDDGIREPPVNFGEAVGSEQW